MADEEAGRAIVEASGWGDGLPVVITGVRAMTADAFNLHGLAATTHWACPLLIVDGPVARELGFNGGTGAFGNGTRANAVVGRALRLVMMNVGAPGPGASPDPRRGLRAATPSAWP